MATDYLVNLDQLKIQGNINAKGDHIYHVPGSRDYAASVITESKGDRWFCSEEEARRHRI